jgi:hypothetical protein
MLIYFLYLQISKKYIVRVKEPEGNIYKQVGFINGRTSR